MFKNLVIASFLGLTAVLLGAFEAHALKNVLSPEALKSFEIGIRYQIYHAILLLIVNIYQGFTAKQKNILSYLFILGTVLFSGSLYLIQLTSITAKQIWFVTPLGGVFLILGWSYLAIIFLRKSRN